MRRKAAGTKAAVISRELRGESRRIEGCLKRSQREDREGEEHGKGHTDEEDEKGHKRWEEDNKQTYKAGCSDM